MSDRPTPEQILAFWHEAGVDACVGDEPVDRFAESAEEQARAATMPPEPSPRAASLPRTGPSPRTEPSRSAAPAPPRGRKSDDERRAEAGLGQVAIPDEQAISDARSLAEGASTLEELRDAVEQFRGVNLAFTAKNPCFADGNPAADLMVIGEAPGRDEDIQGLPFVGRSGQLLDRILKAIGRDRSDTYITNVIYWRPPGNRKPTLHEIHICQAFIERQILLADPKVLVFTGNTPTQTLLSTKDGIMRTRGRWRDYTPPGGTRAIPAMPTLHPAFLLRQPQQKRNVWADMLEVRAKLTELAG